MEIFLNDSYCTKMEPIIDSVLNNHIFSIILHRDVNDVGYSLKYGYYLLYFDDKKIEQNLKNYFMDKYELYLDQQELQYLSIEEFILLEDKTYNEFYIATNIDIEIRCPMKDEYVESLIELVGCKYFINVRFTDDELKELKKLK